MGDNGALAIHRDQAERCLQLADLVHRNGPDVTFPNRASTWSARALSGTV